MTCSSLSIERMRFGASVKGGRTNRVAAPIPFRSQPADQVFSFLYTHITGRSGYTSRNSAALGLFATWLAVSKFRKECAHIPHLTFLCLQSSHLEVQLVVRIPYNLKGEAAGVA